ncbi:orotate phosphoribosyltransferase [soil metagenome]
MHAMDRRQLATAIFERSHLTGEFLLRSGQVSHEYFDKYRFEADPQLLRAIAHALAPHVPDDTDVLAGLELGGVPLAVMLGQVTGIPTTFVRKAAKAYGTRKVAEGADVDGARVVVIEDVVTSGGQVIASTDDLRALGAVVEHAVCVIDREAGGGDALAEEGVVLRPLFTMSQLKALRG